MAGVVICSSKVGEESEPVVEVICSNKGEVVMGMVAVETCRCRLVEVVEVTCICKLEAEVEGTCNSKESEWAWASHTPYKGF